MGGVSRRSQGTSACRALRASPPAGCWGSIAAAWVLALLKSSSPLSVTSLQARLHWEPARPYDCRSTSQCCSCGATSVPVLQWHAQATRRCAPARPGSVRALPQSILHRGSSPAASLGCQRSCPLPAAARERAQDRRGRRRSDKVCTPRQPRGVGQRRGQLAGRDGRAAALRRLWRPRALQLLQRDAGSTGGARRTLVPAGAGKAAAPLESTRRLAQG